MDYKTIGGPLLLAAGLLCGSSLAMAYDRGEMLANTCIGCHGAGGSSGGPAIPHVAGLQKDTFMDTMHAYQKAERPSTIMTRIAKGYTDEELEAMAGYFSQQKLVLSEQKVDAAQAKAGGKLHEEYCEKCHEDGGTKDVDGSAVLAGQWKPYLDFQLADFADGKREMSKKMAKRMESMIKEHGKESLEAISNYYASHK